MHLALYLQHLSESVQSKAAVEEAVHALSWLHELAGLKSVGTSPVVQATLRMTQLTSLLPLFDSSLVIANYVEFSRLEDLNHTKSILARHGIPTQISGGLRHTLARPKTRKQLKELKFWSKSIKEYNSQPVWHIEHLQSDVCTQMLVMWGMEAILWSMACIWDRAFGLQRKQSSIWRELVAVEWVLQSVAGRLSSTRVCWFMDNKMLYTLCRWHGQWKAPPAG